MPDITTIQDQIRARLTEVERLMAPLRLEADQLTKMASTFAASAPARKTAAHSGVALSTTRKSASRKPRAVAPAGAKRGRPLGSGNRAQQAVAKIIDQPGITASELAKSMGISPNYLYRVLPRLERESKVTKQGKGYHPVSADEAAAGTPNGQPVVA